MAPPVIDVSGLSKRYQIGALHARHDTFAEQIGGWARGAVRAATGRRPRSDELWALRDVSFSLDAGEVLGVVGRNGAGKTTLLKILARITGPTAGEATIRGRLGTLLEVGTGFHPELTGRENVSLNGAILGMSRREINAKFDEIVEFSGVERFIDTPVKRYSSGMYVRLAFAVAAHLEPDILVVDEVLAVGDFEFQRRCLGKMRDVAGEGRTVLFVSHNLPALRSLCTRAIRLEAGRLVADADPESVVREYLAEGASSDGVVPATAHRPTGTGEIQVRRVRLLGAENTPQRDVFFGQPFGIELLCEAEHPVADAAFEIGLSTPDGLRVATVTTLDRGQESRPVPAGFFTVAAQLDMTLLPGEYAVDVSIHHWLESKLTMEWVERTLTFRALDVPESGNDHYISFSAAYSLSSVRGFVRPEARWTDVEIAEAPKGEW
jgi:ABC-type polysaccharide/polyol phosphate transport system ATPase subunit